ncbi:MAG: ferritin-like domain-containing protein [Ilumatobacter sp.]|jgi:rubrerythrin|uniref:ferritin-like domain-containing protein n=1 Tax=Ilumatobacter sp. TaxID=1967498 RepID=UPI003919D29E
MTSKGPSHVDLETAVPAAEPATGRRNLIGLAGFAGLAGAAAALLSSQPVAAVPTSDDIALLREALRLELSARDLYQAQLDAHPNGSMATAVKVMLDNHEAYAQAIAGATGLSIVDVGRNDQVFDDNVEAFEASDFAAAAHTIEQTAVSTHTALLGDYESADALALTSSILVAEARHATVLADVLGVDDFDVLFGNDQPALDLAGSDA